VSCASAMLSLVSACRFLGNPACLLIVLFVVTVGLRFLLFFFSRQWTACIFPFCLFLFGCTPFPSLKSGVPEGEQILQFLIFLFLFSAAYYLGRPLVSHPLLRCYTRLDPSPFRWFFSFPMLWTPLFQWSPPTGVGGLSPRKGDLNAPRLLVLNSGCKPSLGPLIDFS